jgi:fido (protein-threonine AMPylation protein)
MTDLFEEPDDATPLDPGQRDGLLQSWITTRNDLNEAEQENIVKGAAWARQSRGAKAIDLLNDGYAKNLHKQMFGEVWKWAGTYRQNEINLASRPSRFQWKCWRCSMMCASGSRTRPICPTRSRCACTIG